MFKDQRLRKDVPERHMQGSEIISSLAPKTNLVPFTASEQAIPSLRRKCLSRNQIFFYSPFVTLFLDRVFDQYPKQHSQSSIFYFAVASSLNEEVVRSNLMWTRKYGQNNRMERAIEWISGIFDVNFLDTSRHIYLHNRLYTAVYQVQYQHSIPAEFAFTSDSYLEASLFSSDGILRIHRLGVLKIEGYSTKTPLLFYLFFVLSISLP